MSYIPDPGEMMEAAAERRYYEQLDDNGDYHCPGCGKIIDLEDAWPAGPSPDAAAICESCAFPQEQQSP